MEKHKKCIARILVFEFYAAGYAHAILFWGNFIWKSADFCAADK